jgi:predicted NUDIX family NTP pyrophosphohydrolase
MAKKSAGVLLFREGAAGPEVLLAHPGGPFWKKKDEGAWSIPKGEYEDGDDPMGAAKREFEEEMGAAVDGKFVTLGSIKQAGGKVVSAWAVRGDFEVARLRSNTFSMEWPPRSGKQQVFPEVDRAEWFGLETARGKILKGQAEFLDRLATELSSSTD